MHSVHSTSLCSLFTPVSPTSPYPVPITDAEWGFYILLNASQGCRLSMVLVGGHSLGHHCAPGWDWRAEAPPALLWQGQEIGTPLSLLTPWPWDQGTRHGAEDSWKVSSPAPTHHAGTVDVVFWSQTCFPRRDTFPGFLCWKSRLSLGACWGFPVEASAALSQVCSI